MKYIRYTNMAKPVARVTPMVRYHISSKMTNEFTYRIDRDSKSDEVIMSDVKYFERLDADEQNDAWLFPKTDIVRSYAFENYEKDGFYRISVEIRKKFKHTTNIRDFYSRFLLPILQRNS